MFWEISMYQLKICNTGPITLNCFYASKIQKRGSWRQTFHAITFHYFFPRINFFNISNRSWLLKRFLGTGYQNIEYKKKTFYRMRQKGLFTKWKFKNKSFCKTLKFSSHKKTAHRNNHSQQNSISWRTVFHHFYNSC